ncbi:MAG: metallophosphoesterase [Bacillota bacterium]
MNFLYDYLKHPEWHTQHRWRRAIWMTMSSVGLTGMHSLPVNRRWVDIHWQKMPLQGLDPSLAGLKLVQISDLHYSPVVWRRYLLQFVRWINDLQPDVVAVTGDLITGGYRYAHRIAHLLAQIKASRAVIAIFGNHDYSIYGKNYRNEGLRRAAFLEKSLENRGIVVLRNESWSLHGSGQGLPLTVVGLDDEWSGHMDPDKAYADIDPHAPIVCLNHNPANCIDLMRYQWQWMLAGHTHGRQIATSAFGQAFYPHRFRHFTHGYYSINGRHLYVNRGLSYGQRVLDWCRPEITVFKLEAARRSPKDHAGVSDATRPR